MKKQKKLNIKVRDLDPLKNVTGGDRHRHHRHHKIASPAAPVGWIPNPSGAGKWDY
jgi:hypothetical protein